MRATNSIKYFGAVRTLGRVCLLSTGGLLCFAGCGDGSPTSTTSGSTSGPVAYFAPYVYSTTNVGSPLIGPYEYEIDHTAKTFSQSTFDIRLPQRGPQVINGGQTYAAQRGLLTLTTNVNYVPSNNAYVASTVNLPQAGGFAVELANQAGGFVQVAKQPVVPIVAATQCPVLSAAQTYQFITLPAGLIHATGQASHAPFFDPASDTAYGTADITSDSTKVTVTNIRQYTLSSSGGSVASPHPAPSSLTGLCGPTVLGNTISVPGEVITKDPGGASSTNPQATIGIGATGMLVEDNGLIPLGKANAQAYENVLGDGTGAVGLPRPASPLDVNAVRSAQYLGFVSGAGTYSSVAAPATGWSSHPVSFGFTSTPSGCASVAAATGTMVYGGDYSGDDPASSKDGFGNCDLAIDLGGQSASSNGIFPQATVWIGAAYSANSSGKTYSFPAVVVGGTLGNKLALFVIGADATKMWTIYLLQSN